MACSGHPGLLVSWLATEVSWCRDGGTNYLVSWLQATLCNRDYKQASSFLEEFMNQINKDNKNPKVPYAINSVCLVFFPLCTSPWGKLLFQWKMFSMETFLLNLHSSKINRSTFNFPKCIRGGAHFLAQWQSPSELSFKTSLRVWHLTQRGHGCQEWRCCHGLVLGFWKV